MPSHKKEICLMDDTSKSRIEIKEMIEGMFKTKENGEPEDNAGNGELCLK